MTNLSKSVLVLLSLLLCVVAVEATFNWNETEQNIIIRSDGTSFKFFKNTDQDDQPAFGPALATLDINRTYFQTGWDRLTISADGEMLDLNASAAYYGAGYIEGFYTFDTIGYSWLNWGIPVQNQANTSWADKWIHDNIDYLSNQTRFNPIINSSSSSSSSSASSSSSSSFELQHSALVGRIMQWLRGLTDGYARARSEMIAAGKPGASDAPELSHYQMFLFNFQDEVGDVVQADPAKGDNPDCPKPPSKDFAQADFFAREHCSAIVRVTDDDLFATHATWSHFRTMLRQYKTYHFEQNRSVTLSGYPSNFASSDDWYLTAQRLVVTETTNNQFNYSLSRQFVTPTTIPEWMRVMIANFLADNGKQWVDTYLIQNNGAYCNQYIVVDMKLVSKSNLQTLPANTLWILEQLPGPFSQSEDLTWFLNKNKYWPSFNRAYFQKVADVSCDTYYAQKYGPVWGYKDYCRYEIFTRNYTKVTGLDTLQKLIRYNDWQNDPFSKIPWCNNCTPANGPSLSIAARYDLIPPDTFKYTNASNALKSYLFAHYDGAIDAKITSWKMMGGEGVYNSSNPLRVNSSIICGPTSDQQPVFAWSRGSVKPLDSHVGQPDEFNFPWLLANDLLIRPPQVSRKAKKMAPVMWTAVIVSACVVGVIVIFVVVYKTCISGEVAPSFTAMQKAAAAGNNNNAGDDDDYDNNDSKMKNSDDHAERKIAISQEEQEHQKKYVAPLSPKEKMEKFQKPLMT